MKSPKLLLVDDDQDLLKALRMRFEPKGYQVVTAADGVAAFRLFRDERPDCVLMDVRMPHLDGIAVLREIMEADSKANVIIASGKVTPSQARLALDEGAKEFFSKPLDLGSVEKAVEMLVMMPQA